MKTEFKSKLARNVMIALIALLIPVSTMAKSKVVAALTSTSPTPQSISIPADATYGKVAAVDTREGANSKPTPVVTTSEPSSEAIPEVTVTAPSAYEDIPTAAAIPLAIILFVALSVTIL